MRIRLLVWSVYVLEMCLWPVLMQTHQEFTSRFPGFLVAIFIFAVVSLLLLELPTWITPTGSGTTLATIRTVVAGTVFLAITTFITNPFDWIPQSNHLVREPYWDVFALNILGLLAFWAGMHQLTKRPNRL